MFFVWEIGGALDGNVAILAAIFCADTYTSEISGGRAEVFGMLPAKSRRNAVLCRLFLQMGYLCLTAYGGWFLFFWQRPVSSETAGTVLYAAYLVAVTASIIFWGTLSMTAANVCRNMWGGIGLALILWLIVNSKFGELALGNFNIFAYGFCDFNQGIAWEWLWGKAAGILLAAVMMGCIPYILKKRG